jgi:hypothetical protein
VSGRHRRLRQRLREARQRCHQLRGLRGGLPTRPGLRANAFAPGATSHICSGQQALIVSNAGGAWATWVYTGPLAGRVKLNSGGPLCPDSASGTWD